MFSRIWPYIGLVVAVSIVVCATLYVGVTIEKKLMHKQVTKMQLQKSSK